MRCTPFLNDGSKKIQNDGLKKIKKVTNKPKPIFPLLRNVFTDDSVKKWEEFVDAQMTQPIIRPLKKIELPETSSISDQ